MGRHASRSLGRIGGAATLLLGLALPLAARAAPPVAAPIASPGGQGVDVQLVLAVDVSFSMDLRELALQRQGYQAALRSPKVMEAIRSGLLGRIAVTYVEWAGPGTQVVVVPWGVIDTAASADAFAGRIVQQSTVGRFGTSISSALDYASNLFSENGFDSNRRVIDVSGDGPNNMGVPVVPVRDALVRRGITINGLPLLLERQTDRYSIPDLDKYYSHCVVGGTGSFMIPVRTIEGFEQAVEQKLVQEISQVQPEATVVPAADGADGYDCLIGEKRRGTWYQR